MTDFEVFDGNAIVCPHCGVRNEDAWEIRAESGIKECECGKKFHWERRVDVEYHTKADCKYNNEEHDFDTDDDWYTNEEEPTQEFRVNNCKKCSQYTIDRRLKKKEGGA